MRKLAVLLTLSLSFSAQVGEHSEAFQALVERDWVFRLKEFPALARRNGHKENAGEITHVSEKDQLRRYEFWKQVKQELDAIECGKLERTECINYRIFGRQVHHFIASYETKAYLIPFNSDSGFYLAWSRWEIGRAHV